ncbi:MULTISPECIES: asparagine synthase-related protein [Thermobifida]|uniref:asparagine synthase-related protein n=1 Tax=Thermobifida TaxID=83677 RepID=UPI000CEE3889|nr:MULTISPECIES: asparagine synthase-related protein [Thermobifida]MBO2530673.1 asparagine synthase [Thermobifida sp.]PPS91999.1 asparagine synthase [Thermobifida fusca]PZN60768.1 MAG: asparagine synthase [Thermobifida fusca]
MVGCISPYFAVFPDKDVLGQATDRLPAAQTLASHPSGRPWLVGALPADQLLLVEAGERRLAVIGHCSAEPERLRAELAQIDDVAQFDRLARTLDGSFHLVVVVGDQMRIQGSVSGLRRVFHAHVGTARIAADRSDVLAAVLGVSPDPDVLALRMFNGLPYPLSELPPWPGVEHVPAWHYLSLGLHDGRHRVVQWWHPPEAELDVTAAAPLLRTALAGAVDTRTRGGGVVSADLSGGLDSTPLCALAARGPAKVVALTFSSGLDTDDDLRWAKIAHQSFPSVEHVVLSPEDIPGFYAGLDGEFPLLDEPSVAMLSTPRILSRLHTARAHGSRLHMDGLGGDQLLTGSLSLYHDLLWQRPWTALPLIRGHRLLAGLSLSETFASLADRRDLRAWLADIRHSIATGEPPRRSLFGWDVLPKCGPWLTAEARERVLARFDAVLESLEPLAPTRGRHADLAAIRAAGRDLRLLHQLGSSDLPRMESPFLDDRVVEACLQVRHEGRMNPFEFKSLMKTAMASLLPAEFLTRQSKTDGTPLAAEGFTEQRDRIIQIWRESRLAELGLIHPDVLVERVKQPYSFRGPDWGMELTLTVELWLRSRERVLQGANGGDNRS